MTSDPSRTVISVRGEARRTVAPDVALINCGINVTRTSKAQALRDAATAQRELLTDLAALGGAALAVDTQGGPLTWSTSSVSTHEGYGIDSQTGAKGPTGEIFAAAVLSIAVRDLERLDALAETLAQHEAVSVRHVSWHVDDDNPTWPLVRADAIHAAITKGRDYAAALEGKLVSVEHIADVGLLGTDGPVPVHAGTSVMSRSAGLRSDGMDSPSLDPVPQELVAAIDARFVAGIAALAQ